MANEITKITDQNGVDHPLVDVLGREATVDLLKDTTGWTGKNEVDVTKYNHISTNCVASASGDVMTFTAPTDATGNYAELSYYASQTSDVLFDHNEARKMLIIVTALTSNKAAIGVRSSESRFIKTLKFESTGTYILDLSDVAEDYYVGVYPRWEYNNAEASMTFKLMVYDARLDDTYEPYHESVEEMLTPKLLPSGSNLNNYITEGDYFAGADTYDNCPFSNTAFRLKVLPFNNPATRCIQIIYANKPEPEVYMRTNFGGTWQSWYKFTGTVVS